MLFCDRQQSSPFYPPVGVVIDFLLELYNGCPPLQRGLGYSALGTARSALSTIAVIDNVPAGQHPVVQRFMKAAFNTRPTFPKSAVTWDVDLVLRHLQQMAPAPELSLYLLSQKLCMLLLILTGQRGQTIHLIDIVNMTLSESVVSFRIAELTKTSRPNHHQREIKLKAYHHDPQLCVVSVLSEYLRRTQPLRGKEARLLLSTRPPHAAASRDTIRRWTKEIMAAAGVDLTIFSPHSTRSASTSKAATRLPLATILATAGWSQASTFQKFYNKPVDSSCDFADSILSNVDCT